MNQPLADKMRPQSLDHIVGQTHLFGEKGVIRKMIEQDYIPNMIFYGASGTGKTTAANIVAKSTDKNLYKLNATSATLADIKDIVAQTSTMMGSGGILLYLDEIQYFNKKQQQSLLEYIEDGRITLIASTTENPYFYIYNAILSRSSIFEFKAVSANDMLPTLKRAFDTMCKDMACTKKIDDNTLLHIGSCGAGDVRRSINILENAYYVSNEEVTIENINSITPKVLGNFDSKGDVHYDMLSALQKSIRGSDPDAAIFYLAKILEGGDLISACRRLQVIASEDIGLAYPLAPVIVRACVDSAMNLGMPEAHIPLANATIMLATAPKSNSSNVAYENALTDIKSGLGQAVPPHLHGSYANYKYPHDYPENYVHQQYLPDDIKNNIYYKFGENKTELSAKMYWNKIKNNI